MFTSTTCGRGRRAASGEGFYRHPTKTYSFKNLVKKPKGLALPIDADFLMGDPYYSLSFV